MPFECVLEQSLAHLMRARAREAATCALLNLAFGHAARADVASQAAKFTMVDVLLALGAVLSLPVRLLNTNTASDAQKIEPSESKLNRAAVFREAALAVASEEGTAWKAAALVTL